MGVARFGEMRDKPQAESFDINSPVELSKLFYVERWLCTVADGEIRVNPCKQFVDCVYKRHDADALARLL